MFGNKNEAKPTPVDGLDSSTSTNPDKVTHFVNKGQGTELPVEYITDRDGNKHIVDGNHRLEAARQRGDTHISARESSLPDEIKRNWLGIKRSG